MGDLNERAPKGVFCSNGIENLKMKQITDGFRIKVSLRTGPSLPPSPHISHTADKIITMYKRRESKARRMSK